MKWIPVRVEVDIVYEKAFGGYGCPCVILPSELGRGKGMLLAQ